MNFVTPLVVVKELTLDLNRDIEDVCLLGLEGASSCKQGYFGPILSSNSTPQAVSHVWSVLVQVSS